MLDYRQISEQCKVGNVKSVNDKITYTTKFDVPDKIMYFKKEL